MERSECTLRTYALQLGLWRVLAIISIVPVIALGFILPVLLLMSPSTQRIVWIVLTLIVFGLVFPGCMFIMLPRRILRVSHEGMFIRDLTFRREYDIPWEAISDHCIADNVILFKALGRTFRMSVEYRIESQWREFFDTFAHLASVHLNFDMVPNAKRVETLRRQHLTYRKWVRKILYKFVPGIILSLAGLAYILPWLFNVQTGNLNWIVGGLLSVYVPVLLVTDLWDYRLSCRY
jgi:hypothetical protein